VSFLSPVELMVIAVVAILLFGSKLPEVARSMGSHYREFRRGLNDIQDQFRQAEREVTRMIDAPVKSINQAFAEEEEEIKEPAVPKFTPPPSQPEEP
jgi:sec-independent protein translocase protein TatA